ncbi:MAG: hypothetical protein AAGG44_03300, partial [Planctomycetota bacterium]
MPESNISPQPNDDGLDGFEQELRSLKPKRAEFDLVDIERAALRNESTEITPAVTRVAKSNWTTICASWSTGAAAGVLGTLLSLNLLSPGSSVDSLSTAPSVKLEPKSEESTP